MAALADLLRDARRQAKLTQQDIADRLGVSRQAVTHWEKGKGIDHVHLLALSHLLGIDFNSALADGRSDTAGFAEGRGTVAYVRRRGNLTCEIEEAVLAEAEAHRIDITAVVTRALVEENRAQRMARWRENNREAIREANAELERDGLWSDGLRLF